MQDINVLIVEDDMQSAQRLKSELVHKKQLGKIECAASQEEAIEIMQQAEFDIMVLDIIMAQRDGFHTMEQLNTLSLKSTPDVIVMSAISHENAIRKSFDLGAKYYMIKPCDPDVMYSRILDIHNMKNLPLETKVVADTRLKSKSLDHKIMEILLSLGMPPHLKGYQYLKEAIKMVIAEPMLIYSITKRLYPGIAYKFDVTPTKVELAIRHTIEVAWQRNKMENAPKLFGCEVFSKNSRPTNGELIALVADKINIDMGEE